jgi:transaldolase
MKIFFDTAHRADIKKWHASGVIDGVTLNPSNLSKESGDPKSIIKEICALLPNGHISVEVTEFEPGKVYHQAQKIARLADNIWVKIPCHPHYYEVIKKLVSKGIRLNITLVFTLAQSLMMAKLGVYYISPFIGRWNDIDVDGIAIIQEMRAMIDFYDFKTQILAASIRSLHDFHGAINAGADAITMPVSLFEQAITSPLTDQGIKKFLMDWKKRGVRQFP